MGSVVAATEILFYTKRKSFSSSNRHWWHARLTIEISLGATKYN